MISIWAEGSTYMRKLEFKGTLLLPMLCGGHLLCTDHHGNLYAKFKWPIKQNHFIHEPRRNCLNPSLKAN